jgi:hypothetical protein
MAVGVGSVLIGVDGNSNSTTKVTSFRFISLWHGLENWRWVAAGDGSVLICVDRNMNYIAKVAIFQLGSRRHGFVFVINFQGNEKLPISFLAFCFKDGGDVFLPDDLTVTMDFARQRLYLWILRWVWYPRRGFGQVGDGIPVVGSRRHLLSFQMVF